ncbi:unnamed protein product [Euphydryas editha]|uniref:Uncharacterized protein n=1 Tax=Euphydryas editha TaxID=104508 RepID=A0AAU9TNI9_EUPED|nr:unnamed protein product [Euphydryas editha]CAH2088558.1 unnamed protein product [Euphydryas editha]CAH2088559.1 unnamed protein product [Euphydryas editha]
MREFEDRPVKPRGPTERSNSWKAKKPGQKKPQPESSSSAPTPSYDFVAKTATPPTDEPLYDLGPHTSAIPVQEIYSQNFEFAGYIDQIERTYEILRGIDPRLDRRLPFSMFQHSMCTILHCHLLDLTLKNGEMRLNQTRHQDLLPEDLIIPENLYHFLASVGNTTTVGGEEVKFNLPEAAIPQAQDEDVPSGSFGQVTPESHNAYECYISPLVTANRVLNSRRPPNAPEIPPLPAVLVPAGAVPTPNLLGHGPPDVISLEARPRIEGFDFPNGDSVEARLKICPELMSRVNTVLFEMRAKFKMKDIGRKSPTTRNYIEPKNIPGNVQFVKVIEAVPDAQRLSKRQNQIRCHSSFGSATAGYCNVTCLHRERSNNARGACFLVNGAIPLAWQAS